MPTIPRLFCLWLVLFFAAWITTVLSLNLWPTVLSHWPIALAMAFGSYIAGSTPMGGGTVGFPVLVLLFGYSPQLGRDFAFAVQSIGMTSASIFILAARTPVAWKLLQWALPATLLATPIGVLLIAPHIPADLVKLLFSTLWAAFSLSTLTKLSKLRALNSTAHRSPAFDAATGITVGLLGGACIASVTGVGIDMLIYMALVLLYRCDLRIAIPTSVLLMATTSLVGITTLLLTGRASDGLFGHWIAAAPVVAIGAPTGALVVSLIGRSFTLAVVSILCLGQFLWTCSELSQRLPGWVLLAASLATIAANWAFWQMLRWSERNDGLRPSTNPRQS